MNDAKLQQDTSPEARTSKGIVPCSLKAFVSWYKAVKAKLNTFVFQHCKQWQTVSVFILFVINNASIMFALHQSCLIKHQTHHSINSVTMVTIIYSIYKVIF